MESGANREKVLWGGLGSMYAIQARDVWKYVRQTKKFTVLLPTYSRGAPPEFRFRGRVWALFSFSRQFGHRVVNLFGDLQHTG